MSFQKPPARLRSALVIAGVLGLSLGACREERLQLGPSTAPWPASIGAPHPVMGPPYEGPAPIGQLVSHDDGYAWAERSYAIDEAYYGAQPDYGFHYDGAQPYVWQTADNWAMYAEPYEDDYRFYYYEPGDHYPYFVRDADYGYGYDDFGRLVVMYDLYGRVMPLSFLYERGARAGDYYRRAYALRNASYTTRHITITNNIWRVQEPRVRRAQTVWIDAGSTQQDWVRYRTRTGERDLRAFRGDRRDNREPVLRRVSRTFTAQEIGQDRPQRKLVRVERHEEPPIRDARSDRVTKVKRQQAVEARPAEIRRAKERDEQRGAKQATLERRPPAAAKPRDNRQARAEQRQERRATPIRAKGAQAEKREQPKVQVKSERREQPKVQAMSEQWRERADARRVEAQRRVRAETKVRRPERTPNEARQQATAEPRAEPRKQVRDQPRARATRGERKQRPAQQADAKSSKTSPSKARAAGEDRGQKRDKVQKG